MMAANILERIQRIAERFDEITAQMAEPEIVADFARLNELAQERNEIEELATAFQRHQQIAQQMEENQLLLDDGDPEMRALAEQDNEMLTQEQADLENRMRALLLPKDPNDEKNVIVEIRAGTGGDEAGLFAAELFRMYARWAENHRFKIEILSQSETGLGGLKEVIFAVKGKGAWSQLKWESGTHRVQRVPVTESQGRIHTSAATVAVLPEAEDIDVEVNENDIRVDVFRSSGPGGQSVNTTDSAVRLTHIPTGIVIACQDEKSQLQNRQKAMRILRARLYEMELEKQAEAMGTLRKSQVGSGDRSEKIRTYNFPQSRVTDHRINKTVYQLPAVMDGAIEEFIEELAANDQAERLEMLAVQG